MGDLAEFEDFVAVRQRRLVGVAYLLTRDRQLAEDLVQEAFIKLYRRWLQPDGPGLTEAYVRRIIVHEYVSLRRRRWTHEIPVDHNLGVGEPASPPSEERLLVWHALGTLPPRQRAVLVLRLYEGLDDQEVARCLNCAEGTVRSLASRAYTTLRASCGLLDREATTRAKD